MNERTVRSQFKLSFICLLALLAVSGCGTKVRNAPEPSDPIAYFPKMEVGDFWAEEIDNNIVQMKVISVNPDNSFVMERKDSDTGIRRKFYFDYNYRLEEIKPNTLKKTDHLIKRKFLDFPLFVGKTWKEKTVSPTDNAEVEAIFLVDKYEQVQVKSGKFNAFKIVVKSVYDNREYWYSPQVKYFVKRNPFGTIKGDLIAYNHIGRSPSVDYYGGGKVVKVSDQAKPEEGGIRRNEAAEVPVVAAYAQPASVKANTHWALVVGVSNYRDSRIPSLRYAADDSQAFYDWLVSPEGGKYAPSRVRLLTNEQATGVQIKNAMFEWLRQALAEDVVLVYFSGHGSPESPYSKENLFLLPYDADYENIASTGFPMWDIETALKRFIKAKKVIVVADACHSGGVGKPFDIARKSEQAVTANPISTGLQGLSTVSDGVCIISASDDSQFSQESVQWGGGHGVFTHFLLQGLNGEADYNKDGVVNLGEIIPYLSENVRRATKNMQTPTVAGKFDPALALGK